MYPPVPLVRSLYYRSPVKIAGYVIKILCTKYITLRAESARGPNLEKLARHSESRARLRDTVRKWYEENQGIKVRGPGRLGAEISAPPCLHADQ